MLDMRAEAQTITSPYLEQAGAAQEKLSYRFGFGAMYSLGFGDYEMTTYMFRACA